MVVVIGILIGLAVGAGLAFLSLYAFAGSRLAAARRTRQLLVSEAKRESDVMRREAQSESDALRREGQIEAREASVRLGPRSSRRSPSGARRFSRSRSAFWRRRRTSTRS